MPKKTKKKSISKRGKSRKYDSDAYRWCLWDGVLLAIKVLELHERGELSRAHKGVRAFAKTMVDAIHDLNDLFEKHAQEEKGLQAAMQLSEIYTKFQQSESNNPDRVAAIEAWISKVEKLFDLKMNDRLKQKFRSPTKRSVTDELSGKKVGDISGPKSQAFERMKYCFDKSARSTLFKRQNSPQPDEINATGFANGDAITLATTVAYTAIGSVYSAVVRKLQGEAVEKSYSDNITARLQLLNLSRQALGYRAITLVEFLDDEKNRKQVLSRERVSGEE